MLKFRFLCGNLVFIVKILVLCQNFGFECQNVVFLKVKVVKMLFFYVELLCSKVKIDQNVGCSKVEND